MLSIFSDEQAIYIEGKYSPSLLMTLERSLQDELKKTQSAKSLNLSELVGSDSGLIAVLLGFQRHANSKHWDVSLINANEGIKGLITLSQLEGFFKLSA